jgi:hypothetical protein
VSEEKKIRILDKIKRVLDGLPMEDNYTGPLNLGLNLANGGVSGSVHVNLDMKL